MCSSLPLELLNRKYPDADPEILKSSFLEAVDSEKNGKKLVQQNGYVRDNVALINNALDNAKIQEKINT